MMMVEMAGCSGDWRKNAKCSKQRATTMKAQPTHPHSPHQTVQQIPHTTNASPKAVSKPAASDMLSSLAS